MRTNSPEDGGLQRLRNVDKNSFITGTRSDSEGVNTASSENRKFKQNCN